MQVKSLRCDGCGGPLPAPKGQQTLECSYCGRELQVVSGGTKVTRELQARSITDALLHGYTGEDVGSAQRHSPKSLPLAQWQATERAIWPIQARASSSFGGSWSERGLVGRPRVFPQHGDIGGAWAPRTRDSTIEWVEVAFPGDRPPVSAIRVFETNLPGATFAITTIDASGHEELVWQRRPEVVARQARMLEVTLPSPRPVERVRAYVNNTLGRSWSELDTIGLIAASPLEPGHRTPPWRRPRGLSFMATVGVGILVAVGLGVLGLWVATEATREPGLSAERPEEQITGTRMMVWNVGQPGLAQRGVVWASSVLERSSEYSTDANSAQRALGLPDVYPRYGDAANAWAPSNQSRGNEHLTLHFASTVYASAIAIAETCGPGALVRVDDLTGGNPVVLWEGTTAPVGEARILSLELPAARNLDTIRVVLQTSRVPGWNEIDAVGLVPQRPHLP